MAETVNRGIQALHQAELDQGRFLIQRCDGCERHVYYPREVCPHCGSVSLQLVETPGCGEVHSTTVVRRKAEAGGDYNVALIQLDEGVRLMSRVTNLAPADVKIGQRVRARVEVKDGSGIVLFDSEGSDGKAGGAA